MTFDASITPIANPLSSMLYIFSSRILYSLITERMCLKYVFRASYDESLTHAPSMGWGRMVSSCGWRLMKRVTHWSPSGSYWTSSINWLLMFQTWHDWMNSAIWWTIGCDGAWFTWVIWLIHSANSHSSTFDKFCWSSCALFRGKVPFNRVYKVERFMSGISLRAWYADLKWLDSIPLMASWSLASLDLALWFLGHVMMGRWKKWELSTYWFKISPGSAVVQDRPRPTYEQRIILSREKRLFLHLAAKELIFCMRLNLPQITHSCFNITLTLSSPLRLISRPSGPHSRLPNTLHSLQSFRSFTSHFVDEWKWSVKDGLSKAWVTMGTSLSAMS